MSQFRSMITIGFDKNNQADFHISGELDYLSFDDMERLRKMIPIAIGTAEAGWRNKRDEIAYTFGHNALDKTALWLQGDSGKVYPIKFAELGSFVAPEAGKILTYNPVTKDDTIKD